MRTVVLGERPPELEAALERRRRLGLDRFDEVWEGELHMAPHAHTDHGLLVMQIALALQPYATQAGLLAAGSFNLGEPDDYRVPDGGFHRTRPGGVYAATAPIVVEVVSPDDETMAKLPFYGRRGVQEAIVVLPVTREVRVYDLRGEGPVIAERSELLGVSPAELTAALDWPA